MSCFTTLNNKYYLFIYITVTVGTISTILILRDYNVFNEIHTYIYYICIHRYIYMILYSRVLINFIIVKLNFLNKS